VKISNCPNHCGQLGLTGTQQKKVSCPPIIHPSWCSGSCYFTLPKTANCVANFIRTAADCGVYFIVVANFIRTAADCGVYFIVVANLSCHSICYVYFSFLLCSVIGARAFKLTSISSVD